MVAAYQAVKGTFVLALGLGLLRSQDLSLEEFGESLLISFHLSPGHRLSQIFLRGLDHFQDVDLLFLGAGALAYTLLRYVEAYGLWRERAWGEWLAIVSGALYLPLEFWELSKGFTWFKLLITVANIAFVVYLLRVRKKEHATPRVES